MSPIRRDVLKSMVAVPLVAALPVNVNSEDWIDDEDTRDEPAILHTARFELSMFMEDGRPINLSIETEFDAEGGIWTTVESSRIGKIVSCDKNLDALTYLRKLQSLVEDVATSHRYYEDGGGVCMVQKIRRELPV